MKRYLLAIVLLLPFILQAKVAVEKPRSKQPTAFAIVVDQATYDKTAPQIHAYRDVLEADGLSTYILRDNWQTPEQVREQLIALMRKTAKRSPLEGVVFVGEVYQGFECTIPDVMEKIAEMPDPEPQNTDFLACVRNREPFALDELKGHRSSTLVNLGACALRLNRTLHFDPDKQLFVGDEAANRLIDQPMRTPWKI